ncbi:MAG: TonB-dependent receptor [Bacteroidales bacterium]|nr:TonB-dependent receptor [Bacteroidales bacterium]
MKRQILSILLIAFSLFAKAADPIVVKGWVKDAQTKDPLPGVVLKLDDNYVWAVTDVDGAFLFENLQKGKYTLAVSSLGYVTHTQVINVEGSIEGLVVELKVNTLAINEVVVTAETSKESINTTQKIGRTALDHLQMNSLGGVSSLLPGGKTINPDLTSDNVFSLRSAGSAVGNSAFSTAVEIDGVRIGDNANFGGMKGVGTRSLSVENIESVEVMTGVPFAEYGDFGSGMVKVTTKKGRTPLNVVMTVNPRTYGVSVSKGMELRKGVLNISAEWARAVSKLTSPYTAYTRRGFTADYSATFFNTLRLEAGINGNIGGMNSKNDPDSFSNEYSRDKDNLLTPHFKLLWLLNNNWVTNISLEGSVYYHDSRSHYHKYNSYAAAQPSVHSEEEGYYMAGALPLTYYSDQIVDSKELDYSVALKYHWLRHFGSVKNNFKAGVHWKADGNVGKGEWYEDPGLAADGYRPRPYSDYPYMHTLAAFVEDKIEIPLGRTSLDIMAGLRMESVFISGSEYDNLRILSPRFNAKWNISGKFAIRGGWGVAGKLPSFFILYPRQEYRDIQTFGFTSGGQPSYVYYTMPYKMVYNPNLRWQKNQNSEVGVDAEFLGVKMGLVGFYNLTKNPYELGTVYEPFSYNVSGVPQTYVMPSDPDVVVDHQTGIVYFRDTDDFYVPGDLKVTDQTFAASRRQENGADIHRYGVELTLDFPEIKPIATTVRVDAAWNHSEYTSEIPVYYYQNGWSHTALPNRSYQFAGIYAGNAGVSNGKRTDNLDANITTITHIPVARLVITCRLEASLLRNSRNTSSRAFTVGASDNNPTGEDIYGVNSYTAVYPVAYVGLDGVEHPWTEECSARVELSRLILRSGNVYTFAADGYSPYFSANLSVTKEIGEHVSFSFFANNFLNARQYVTSRATGVSAIFTPNFYYGLTCRIKM